MAVKRQIPFSNGHFFITFTCYNWLPLIDISNGYAAVYRWFNYLKDQAHLITGYVIMPNHVHAMIAFRETEKSLNKIIGDGKRFIGYELMRLFSTGNNSDILQLLSAGVNKTDKKRGKLHEVWEDSFDWKDCRSRDFVTQKLNYIHNNPCSGKWNLVENPAFYTHSSAKYYSSGEQGIYPVTNFMELEDVNLSNPLK